MNYQSYQSGIETVFFDQYRNWKPDLPIVPKWNWNRYHKRPKPNWVFATNRTKVELKLINTALGVTAALTLPIVPKWNWNMIYSPEYQKTVDPTNRTKVELKHLYHLVSIHKNSFYQSYQSGIETVFGTGNERNRNFTTNRTKVELKLWSNTNRLTA